jgi:hypothetical protein
MRIAVLVIVAACGGSSSTELDRQEDIARCKRASTQIVTANPAEAHRIYVRSCQDLYREPKCREAFVHQFDDEDRWPASVAEACARSYCDKLDDPKPKLCATRDIAGGRAALLGAWDQLDRRILALEIGPDYKELLRAPPGTVITVPAPPDAALRDVHLQLEPVGDRLVIHVGALAWQLPESPSAADLQPILATLGNPGDANVVLAAPASTSILSINAVVLVLENAGFKTITFALTK